MSAKRGWVVIPLLVATATSSAAGQGLADYDYENLSFRGFGVDLGLMWPTKVDNTAMYTLRIDLGYLGPGIRLMPSLGYWSSSLERSEVDRLATRLEQIRPIADAGIEIDADDLGEIEWSDLALNLDVHAVWTTALGVYTYAGLGLGVHIMNGRGAAIDDTFVEDLLDSTNASVAAMAGLEYDVTQALRLYGEGRYVLASEFRYPAIRVGLAFMLPGSANAYSGAGQ